MLLYYRRTDAITKFNRLNNTKMPIFIKKSIIKKMLLI